MNSLEWRVKKLENKVLGQTAGVSQVDRILSGSVDHDSILDQLNIIARQYKNCMDEDVNKVHQRIFELYEKYRSLLNELEISNISDETSKVELVLAYEDELIKHMQDIKFMSEKAETVLDIQNWPDLSRVQGRLDKLQTITKEQHVQSIVLDKKTEELIEIYNDIISFFKSNMTIWNQKLEAYENEEKQSEDD